MYIYHFKVKDNAYCFTLYKCIIKLYIQFYKLTKNYEIFIFKYFLFFPNYIFVIVFNVDICDDSQLPTKNILMSI